MLTKQRVDELLSYDSATGFFTWKKPRQGVSVGAIAGRIDSHGHRQIRIDYTRYMAHRLAILVTTGAMPSGDVDHINGARDDNRIANLRIVDNVTNSQNRRRAHSNNKTGFLGVSQSYGRGKYHAQIRHDGRQRHIGSFDDAESAHAAYVEAKRKLHAGCTI